MKLQETTKGNFPPLFPWCLSIGQLVVERFSTEGLSTARCQPLAVDFVLVRPIDAKQKYIDHPEPHPFNITFLPTTELVFPIFSKSFETILSIMGQSSSSYCPHIKRHPTASPSLLLHLPIDILLLISDQLQGTPGAIIALGLTCKAFHSLFIPRAPVLGRRARDFLLLLLETDPGVGSHSYFCPLCRKLHRFSPACGPLTHEHTTDNSEHKYLRPCYDGSSFRLWCGEYSLG